MNVKIIPSAAEGTLTAPPSKSMAHRMLICAGLAKGESVVHNIAYSQDVLATIDCLKALGAEIETDGNTVRVKGIDTKNVNAEDNLNCRECGSTIRFFVPLCLCSENEITLTGSERLLERPMSEYERICREQKLGFSQTNRGITVKGKITSGEFVIDGRISSQFISGLLFALPLIDGDSRIKILPPVESRPYINLTLSALKKFGIEADWETDNVLYVKGNQTYNAEEVTVEGDWSNAAFFEGMNCTGNKVNVEGLDYDSLQGDKICLEYFDKIKNKDKTIDISDCPDLGPVLFAVSCFYGGGSFTGTKRLKIKESDRAEAMKQELLKIGADVRVTENDVEIICNEPETPAEPISSHNDHRIAMAMSLILMKTGGIIEDAQCVSKSLPEYFEILKTLKVKVEIQ